MKSDLLSLLNELIDHQKKTLYHAACAIIPHVTEEDLLQPNDFPDLEFHPHFRYEEGTLHGLQVAQAAILRLLHEIESSATR
jgi:hypothetical protein